MSEKFVVGQWVTVEGHDEVGRISHLGTCSVTVEFRKYVLGVHRVKCQPFLWKVGKTYKTTLDGVTVRVVGIDSDGDVVGMPWEGNDYRHWRGRTGRLIGHDSDETKPHLLPYLADEPPPESDAATFSEFADADECNPQPAVPSSMENKIAGIYCCDVVQYFNFNIGSAITSLWTCDVGTNADDAMLSLKAAAWFVQREIERRAKR